jgi:hypothetical protein
MQQYVQNTLHRVFIGEWLTHEERRHDPDQAILRNLDNLRTYFQNKFCRKNAMGLFSLPLE